MMRIVPAFFAVFIMMGAWAPLTAQSIADEIKRQLEHFQDYLSKCPEGEIRCLWFLDNRVGCGMVMTIDLHQRHVYTVRDVFNHALQASNKREMSHDQIKTAVEAVQKLPESHNIGLGEGLSLSFWKDNKLHTVRYSRSATPLIVQRLYDAGGGRTSFVYENK